MSVNSYSDSGIVIRRHPVSEYDLFLTVFTKYHGKVSVRARGVRRVTSKRAGHVGLFNVISFQARAKGEWLTLTEVEASHTFDALKSNEESLRQAYHVSELVNVLIARDDKQPVVFDKTLSLLQKLDSLATSVAYSGLSAHVRDYEIDVLKILGYWSDDMFASDYPTSSEERERYHIQLIEEVAERKFKAYRTLGAYFAKAT